MSSILFTPVNLGSFQVKNRFVRSATQDFLGNPDGTISDQEIQLYKSLAANHVGMIITAHSYVQHPFGKASINQNAIYDDTFIEGYRKLANEVHNFGTKLVLQASHAGRQTLPNSGFIPVAPSAVPEQTTHLVPRELNETEINQIIDDFVYAMVRAKEAGCDGVQLHIAHGYLLAQFISPLTNRRSDKWGGSIRNRTRILSEIILRARPLLGDFPILVKLNTTDGYEGSQYLEMSDVLYTAKLLQSLGVVAIEVSGGIRDTPHVMSQPCINSIEKEGYFLIAAKAIKQSINIPVILVGGLRSLSVMEEIVSIHKIDMVALSRPFICEVDLLQCFLNGRSKSSCKSCNKCNKQSSCVNCFSKQS